jgi:hypothetical protein
LPALSQDAITFLLRAQRDDSARPGFWGINFLYATCFAMRGLAAAEIGPDDAALRVIRRSRRKLIREYVRLTDLRYCGEEFVGMRHEGCGDLAGEMRLAARLVIEGIEDREGILIVTRSKPSDRAGLGRHQALSARQESGNLFFLAWLCLEFNVERNTGHGISPEIRNGLTLGLSSFRALNDL